MTCVSVNLNDELRCGVASLIWNRDLHYISDKQLYLTTPAISNRLITHLLSAGVLYRQKLDGPYDNRVMPVVLSVTLIVTLSITFASNIIAFQNDS